MLTALIWGHAYGKEEETFILKYAYKKGVTDFSL